MGELCHIHYIVFYFVVQNPGSSFHRTKRMGHPLKAYYPEELEAFIFYCLKSWYRFNEDSEISRALIRWGNSQHCKEKRKRISEQARRASEKVIIYYRWLADGIPFIK